MKRCLPGRCLSLALFYFAAALENFSVFAQNSSTVFEQGKCETGWFYNAQNDCCYFRSGKRKTWMDSELECHARNSHLASIDDDDENDFVFRLMNDLEEVDRFWVGLRRNDPYFDSYWSDGAPINYTAWMPGQPDNLNVFKLESCGEVFTQEFYLHRTKQVAGQWNDVRCDKGMAYVCKKSLDNFKININRYRPKLDNEYCQKGWRLLRGRCFKMFGRKSDLKSFEDALISCHGFGGINNRFRANLVTIRDVQDQNFLNMLSWKARGNAWIGLRVNNKYEMTNFSWADDLTVENFTNFLEPNKSHELTDKMQFQMLTSPVHLGKWVSAQKAQVSLYACMHYPFYDKDSVPFSHGHSEITAENDRCPAGFEYYAEKCFKVIGAAFPFEETAKKCENSEMWGSAETLDPFESSFIALKLSTKSADQIWISKHKGKCRTLKFNRTVGLTSSIVNCDLSFSAICITCPKDLKCAKFEDRNDESCAYLGPKWVNFGQSCYLVPSVKATFYQAYFTCNQMTHSKSVTSMNLAEFSSQQELEFVFNIFRMRNDTFPMYVGTTRDSSADKFYWLTTHESVPWFQVSDKLSNCITFDWYGFYSSASCLQPFAFMCQAPVSRSKFTKNSKLQNVPVPLATTSASDNGLVVALSISVSIVILAGLGVVVYKYGRIRCAPQNYGIMMNEHI